MADFVFLFPGQGSQSKGMLDPFLSFQVVQNTLEEASDALAYDMAALIHEDVDEKLGQTEFTQPALLTASIALLRLWREQGGAEASQVAGHSLGEYSALVAAGVMAFSDAVKLVAFRGRAMSEAVAVGEGSMAAILGLDDAVVEQLCADVSDGVTKVWAANYNCPGQLVVAGHAAAVTRLIEEAKASGARRALPLAVSAPSHTPLMQPAAKAMAEKLQQISFSNANCPVWSNATATPQQGDEAIRASLVAQLTSPVRWTETIQGLSTAGISAGVEMGPGKVLAGLVKRIDRSMKIGVTVTPAQLDASLAALGEL